MGIDCIGGNRTVWDHNLHMKNWWKLHVFITYIQLLNNQQTKNKFHQLYMCNLLHPNCSNTSNSKNTKKSKSKKSPIFTVIPNCPKIFILHTNQSTYYLTDPFFVILSQHIYFDLAYIIHLKLILWSNLDY